MSKGSTVTVEIPEEIRRVIQERVELTGRDFSSVAGEMLTEAVKMARVPGIVFVDGPAGRRARVSGTGLEVFEIIDGYRSVGRDWERLRAAYHWLSEDQLRAALTYAELYPEELEVWLVDDEPATLEEFWEAHPFARPKGA